MSYRDDDRSSRRRDDDDRPSRRRDDEDRPTRRSRDDDDRGNRSRDRDDDRRGGRGSSGRSGFEYHRRTTEEANERAAQGASDFDRIIKGGVKVWKPQDGDNCIRILPPTWKGAKHYGLDIYVHYGVGADRGQYLDLTKMLDKPDPITEEWAEARREGDEKYAKQIESKRRVLVYLIDRNAEKEGVQIWAMPWTLDRDIVKVSVDKASGEVLPIDHPDEGFDVTFEKKGSKDRTEYIGCSIARRSSPLGKDSWLDYAIDHPLPDQLQYFDYDHIAKAFGAAGAHRSARGADDDRDDDRGRGPRGELGRRDRDDDDDRGRGGRDRGSSRDRDDDRRSSKQSEPELDWGTIHDMTKRELYDLVEQKDLPDDLLDIDDLEELADSICEELDIKKPRRERAESRGRDSEPEEGSARDRLRRMRGD